MDDLDKKIIAFVQKNGRASYHEIGEAVKLSVSAVNERLKKMQKQKIIRGWHAQVDPKAVGLEVLAFIYIDIDTPANEKEFAKHVKRFHEIVECHHVTGEWSYLTKIRTYSIADLEILISDKIKTIPGVMRTQTVIALSSPKDANSE